MNRRSLLRGLLLLPLAPLALRVARALPPAQPLTLLDVVRRSDHNLLPVVEALSQQNALLQDATWYEGDLETGHRIWHRTQLPEVTFRRISYREKWAKLLKDRESWRTKWMDISKEIT